MRANRILIAIGVVSAGSVSMGQLPDLILDVQSGGSNAVTVAPGDTVSYQVWGQLSDITNNEGLALFGFDLTCTGPQGSSDICDLPPADIPTGDPAVNPLVNFVRPLGITNPDDNCNPADPVAGPNCGFGGTIMNGDIGQGGGAQNTIKNVDAAFPTGTVIRGVGDTRIVLMSGSFQVPAVEGVYVVDIPGPSVFGNVIEQGETGAGAFWAVKSLGTAPVITPLTVTVVPPCGAVSWTSLGDHGSLGELGLAMEPTGLGADVFVEPRLSGLSKIQVDFSCAIDPTSVTGTTVDVRGCFADGTGVDLTGRTVTPTLSPDGTSMTITISPPLPGSDPFDAADRPARYTMTLNGLMSAAGVGVTTGVARDMVAMLADVDGDVIVGNGDVGGVRFIRDSGPILPGDPQFSFFVRSDVDNDGVVGNADVGGVRSVRDGDPSRNSAPTLGTPCPPG